MESGVSERNDVVCGNGTDASVETDLGAIEGSEKQAQTRYIPVPDWPLYHPWPSERGLRWLIYRGKETGFERVVRRVGRRVLIDEAAFLEWISTRGNCANV